jgi:hypothetical protein
MSAVSQPELELPPDLEVVMCRVRIEGLERDLDLAEARIAQLEGQLIAAGALDPELGP